MSAKSVILYFIILYHFEWGFDVKIKSDLYIEIPQCIDLCIKSSFKMIQNDKEQLWRVSVK